jgi:hypothetical protein
MGVYAIVPSYQTYPFNGLLQHGTLFENLHFCNMAIEVGSKSFKGRKPKLSTMRDMALQAESLEELFKFYKFHSVIELIRLYRTTLDERVKFSCLSRLADLQLGKTRGEMKLLRQVKDSANPEGIEPGAWKYLEARLSRTTYGETASHAKSQQLTALRALEPWPVEPCPPPVSPATRDALATGEQAKEELQTILKSVYPKSNLMFVEKT